MGQFTLIKRQARDYSPKFAAGMATRKIARRLGKRHKVRAPKRK
jgi:hypothetical protein